MSYLDAEIVVYLTMDQEKLYTIYKVTNTVNGKCYIGFSNNYKRRKSQHLWDTFNKNKHTYNTLLYRAIRKYGIDAFTWEVLYQDTNHYFTLNVMEPFFIEKYRTFCKYKDCNGYNLTLGGGGSVGIKRIISIDTKNKISNTMRGRILSEHHILNQTLCNRDRICITDGVKNKRIKKTEIIPNGWILGRISSEKEKHVMFINNGIINKKVSKFSIIPVGWLAGRCKKPTK